VGADQKVQFVTLIVLRSPTSCKAIGTQRALFGGFPATELAVAMRFRAKLIEGLLAEKGKVEKRGSNIQIISILRVACRPR